MIIRSYKYKLRPAKEQEPRILEFMQACRATYNWAVEEFLSVHENENKYLTAYDLLYRFTEHRKTVGYLMDAPTRCERDEINTCVRRALDASRKRKRLPDFKRKKDHYESMRFADGCRLDFSDPKRLFLYIPKIGNVRMCLNRTFDAKKVKLCLVTISQTPDGTFWCSAAVEEKGNHPVPKEITRDNVIGIDRGVKELGVCSDGTRIANPKFEEKSERDKKYYQREYARLVRIGEAIAKQAEEGSKEYVPSKRSEKVRKRMAAIDAHVSNQYKDCFIKAAKKIIAKGVSAIIFEDLNVKGMVKRSDKAGKKGFKKGLSKAISRARFGAMYMVFKWEGTKAGVTVAKNYRFDPTSKTCHVCGYVLDKLSLKTREWTCPMCGTRHDRDLNAAVNIAIDGFQAALDEREKTIKERAKAEENAAKKAKRMEERRAERLAKKNNNGPSGSGRRDADGMKRIPQDSQAKRQVTNVGADKVPAVL